MLYIAPLNLKIRSANRVIRRKCPKGTYMCKRAALLVDTDGFRRRNEEWRGQKCCQNLEKT